MLRTSTLALCYSVAEYCAPVWNRCPHTNLIDVRLRESLSTISGCLKSTPTQWLPVKSSLTPPHIRRENANQEMVQRVKDMPENMPLKQIMNNAPTTTRLKSRRPFYRSEVEEYNAEEAWRAEWAGNTPRGGNIIQDVTQPLPGFKHQKRKYWVTGNRLLTGHGRTACNMHRWGLRDSPMCLHCRGGPETPDHLVLNCPVTKLGGGYETVKEAGDVFTSWVDTFNLEV